MLIHDWELEDNEGWHGTPEHCLSDKQLHFEIPELIVCEQETWPECGRKVYMGDNRIVFICAKLNAHIIKERHWQLGS